VVDEELSIVRPGRHVDGTVDLRVEERCDGCHGDLTGAPPPDTLGHGVSSDAGVGAHRAHLRESDAFRPVRCDECHLVPQNVLDPGHLDSALPAEVVFSGVALSFGAQPSYDGQACAETSCHGAVFPDGDDSGGLFTEPEWVRVDGSQTACGGCHALPPRERPHPDIAACSECHKTMNPDNLTFSRPDLHADGKVDFRP
jgi:predicted CxxxxCH...CXXCH cytochrome family protein